MLMKGGRGCNGISSNGWEGWAGFRWARIKSPRSPGKSSNDHVHESTLFSHSWIGRGHTRILTDELRSSRSLIPNASIRGRLSTQNQQLSLTLDFAGDLDRFGDHVEDLLVHRLAVAGNKKQVERWAVRLADEEYRRVLVVVTRKPLSHILSKV